jgi:hypothetical protein
MRFRDSLFQVAVAVEPDGIVTIEDERVLVDEDRPLAGEEEADDSAEDAGSGENAGSGEDARSGGDAGDSTGEDA